MMSSLLQSIFLLDNLNHTDKTIWSGFRNDSTSQMFQVTPLVLIL